MIPILRKFRIQHGTKEEFEFAHWCHVEGGIASFIVMVEDEHGVSENQIKRYCKLWDDIKEIEPTRGVYS